MNAETNTQRDELAQIAYLNMYTDPTSPRIQPLNERTESEIGRHYRAADDILAAGYRKPRTITTVEELDALPDEALVRSDFGVIHEKRVEFDTGRVVWTCPGDTDEHTAGKITLPATVLYTPEAAE